MMHGLKAWSLVFCLCLFAVALASCETTEVGAGAKDINFASDPMNPECDSLPPGSPPSRRCLGLLNYKLRVSPVCPIIKWEINKAKKSGASLPSSVDFCKTLVDLSEISPEMQFYCIGEYEGMTGDAEDRLEDKKSCRSKR